MAINFRPCIQISSGRFTDFRLFKSVNSWRGDAKLFWSWRKRENPKSSGCRAPCKPENVYLESTCRRRLPQCPDHLVDKLDGPSRCCEKGYGKVVKVKTTWWTNVKRLPAPIKQKPSNCDPPPCPKPETFADYIFGPEKALPEPLTCRRAWKIKQSCNLEDPRLEDPRYQPTEGDVLLYTEPDKRRTLPPKEPQPLSPSPYKAPAGVICKRYRDTVASTALECYCACVDPCLFHPECPPTDCCPVHTKAPKFPYDEMKPRRRRKKYFIDERGIAAEDVTLPPRRESCSCVHSAFEEKLRGQLPERETCDLHEALARRGKLLKRNDCCVEGSDDKAMSRCERLRQIVGAKEREMSEPKVPPKKPPTCESRCACKDLVVRD